MGACLPKAKKVADVKIDADTESTCCNDDRCTSTCCVIVLQRMSTKKDLLNGTKI